MLIKIIKQKVVIDDNRKIDFFEKNNIIVYVKGYFEYGRRIFVDKEASEIIYNHYTSNNNSIQDFNIFNGCFYALIYDKENNKFLLFNDRIGAVPLFYTKLDDKLIISDNFNILKNSLDNHTIDELAIMEILCGNYTSGERTILKDIKNLYPASYLIINLNDNQESSFHRYWHFMFRPIKWKKKEFEREFVRLVENIFDDFSGFIKRRGYYPIVPLSGGYDSRLIANELKKRLNNISSLVYGKENCDDFIYGSKVAKALGINLIQLKLYPNIYDSIYGTKEYNELIKNWNCRSNIHMETMTSLLALKETEKKLFIPGHSLDMMAGSHIDYRWFFMKPDGSQIINDMFTNHFTIFPFELFEKSKKEVFNLIKNDIAKERFQNEDPISFSQRWNMENRQSKFIINSVRAYDVLGYKWVLPLWDYRIIDFFLKLPLKYKFEQKFYHRLLEEYIFDNKIKDFNKKESSINKYSSLIKVICRDHILKKMNIIKTNKMIYPLYFPEYVEIKINNMLNNKEFINKLNFFKGIIKINSKEFRNYLKHPSNSTNGNFSKINLLKLLDYFYVNSDLRKPELLQKTLK